MDWILIVSETREIELITMACLQKTLPCEFVRVRNLAAARTGLMENGRRDCKLIVSSLAPPTTAQQAMPVDRGVPTAFDFLREVRGTGTEPPCIFIDPAPGTEHSLAQRDLPRTQLMAMDDMPAHLAEYALAFLAGTVRTGAEDHQLDVDVVLGRQICLWSVTNTQGAGVPERGHFKLTGDDLERLVNTSQAIGETRIEASELRRKLVRQLGRDMYGHFTSTEPGTASLWDSVSRHTDRMRTLEKARFHFQVDTNTSELLVEALRRKDTDVPENDDYWLLQTPIVRRFGDGADRLPLFKDYASRTAPVKCLIILGDPSKFAVTGVLNRTYEALDQAADEVAWLHQYLTDNRHEFKLAPPEILRYSDYARGSFGPAVYNALAADRWQLIHYSGHSDIGPGRTGYLVLGDHPADLIDIDGFARACAHAQFIFLNSCRSANASFIQRSVERNIPAVAGYAWPIRDDIAAEFSRTFYTNLFGEPEKLSNRFLEYAFMRARRHLHREYQTDTVWSSPLLFMQSSRSERDRPARSLS
jgi:CHAT domain